MNKHFIPLATLLTVTSSILAAPKPSTPDLKSNPFAKESSLPFHYPPFDKIKNADFMPAIEAGMAEELKEMKAIAASPGKPTFENTIVAIDKSGQLLVRAQRTFSNLN